MLSLVGRGRAKRFASAVSAECGIIQTLNLVYFAQVLFIFKLSSGLYVRVVKLLCDLCSVAMSILVYNNNNNNDNNNNNNTFKFRPFLLRYKNTIQWLPVVHGLHSLSCIAKTNTRDLSSMNDTLKKDRDPMFNKKNKFSNSITYFRNRTMLFCNLFIYPLPPSVILSVNEDSF